MGCDPTSATKQHMPQARGFLRTKRWWVSPRVARAERRDRKMLPERGQETAQTSGGRSCPLVITAISPVAFPGGGVQCSSAQAS